MASSRTDLDWDRLIQERDLWVAHNFPDPDGSRTPLDSVLGCIEECGELTHAHLKQVQKIRGDVALHEADAKDAIGDLTVYLLGVMSYYGTKPRRYAAEGWHKASADDELLELAKIIGELAMAQLAHPGEDHHMTDRITALVTSITVSLRSYCMAREWDYELIVENTWDSVRVRDWIRYPDSGLPK